MVDVNKVVVRAWEAYRKKFPLISVGIAVALITTIILVQVAYWLVPEDSTILFLISTFLLGSIYVASRYAAKESDPEELAQVLARFILNFSIFLLLLMLGYVFLPRPLVVIYELIVGGLFYLSVPIVAELGYKKGCERVKNIVKKHGIIYMGLNWFFLLLLLSIVALTPTQELFPIAFVLIVFFYMPLYSLTAYYLAHSARGT